jgi:hypothetical protein
MPKGEVTGFVDESIRGQRYLLSCVFIETKHLSKIRISLHRFVGPNRHVHFRHESNTTRAAFLELISSLDVSCFIVETRMDQGVNTRVARAKCISLLVNYVQDRSKATRLVIEDFSDSKSDVQVIQAVRKKSPILNFEHRDGKHCPELWIADAIVWAYGFGPRWKNRVQSLIDTHLTID